MSVGLDGYRTNAEGYFVIGASTSMENPDISLPSTGFLHRGPDGVAIYRAPSMAFTYGSIAEPQSVVDALVYSLTEDSAVTLETKLTPGYPTFHQRSDYSSSSISRCYGNNRRNPTKFGLADPSPGKPNNCSSATKIFKNIIINEVNIEQASENSNTEFIELYDLGVGGTSLDGLSLIFFDGDNQDRSYFEVDLNGERTNPDGFFTIGRANAVYIPDKVINYNFLQDGPDAIVLYLRSISDFPRATTATLEGAVDVLVYGSNSDVTSTLIEKLVLGQIQINEQQYHLDGKGSLSRCLSNETMIQSAFVTSYLTPGSMNNCTLFPIYINEINFVTTNGDNSDFIELYDGGKGFTALDSLVLVFFSEISSFAFKSLPLQNNQTDINGYFTVGGVDVGSDLTIDSAATWGMLARYPGAVALYRGNHLDYQIGMAPSTTNLIDVVILGSKDNPATNLASALSPDQSQIVEEKFFLEGEESVSRCRCCNAMQTSEFGLGPASPRGPNTCMTFNELVSVTDSEEEEDGYIVINEVSLVTEQGGSLPMEIEILSSPPGRRLDNYVVIYYTSDQFGSSSYLILSLSGEATDEDGYFSLTQDKASRMEKLQHSRGIGGVQGVALYDRRMGQYSYNMQVTDVGLVDAVTFSNGVDDTVKPLQTVLTPPTPAIVTSVAAKNFWASRQPLSLSRCGCCSTRNNSVFTLSSWTPDKPNHCPSADDGTVIQLRLSNAIYSQWISYAAWQMFLKEALVREVESNCQCGFSLSYFSDEILYEGSVVYEALLMALDERQGRSIVEAFEKFIRENSTITIMDQMFLLDDCTHCILSPRLQRKGKVGGILLSLLGVVVMSALLVIIVMVARLYRGDLQMLYIKTFKSRGSSDGVKFNNNDGGGLDVNIDDGISNPVYQGSSQDDGKISEPQFQDPAVNTSGEVPYIVTC
ncbi:hypothetical protein BSL78_01579 [Apostichopus japonicus]|uniref:Uncharacterized protein n=1 Tax=Stichopus japonicus TaxID=307972 RepID=A0A2G8LMJ5_STIJA|nr:hypothetical protein BSL78_01579 [Apostichopus japonicus]